MANPLQLSVPANLPFIDWSRDFEYLPSEVFTAHSDPDLLALWMSPPGATVSISRYDFSTGGSFNYTRTGPADTAVTFNGVFHTVRIQELVIQTLEPGGSDSVTIVFLRFGHLPDGGTRLTGHSVYPTVPDRNRTADPALAAVLGDGFARLEDLLASDSPGAWGLADQIVGWELP